MATRKGKLNDLVNYRLRVVTLDGRQLTGQMLAFDKHMNMVLSDCQEFRVTKKSRSLDNPTEESRTLGLVILRGETIISCSVEGPPPDQRGDRMDIDSGRGGFGFGGRGGPSSRGGGFGGARGGARGGRGGGLSSGSGRSGPPPPPPPPPPGFR